MTMNKKTCIINFLIKLITFINFFFFVCVIKIKPLVVVVVDVKNLN